MANRNTFVGMDVHKQSIDISVADQVATAKSGTTR